MNADDGELSGKGCFELAQLCQRMHAVDTTKSPEVDDDDATAQVFDV